MLNYPLVYDFLNNLIPTCCLICGQRQYASVCDLCISIISKEAAIRKCIICANPNLSWVCKRCMYARWSFDATHALSSDTSRILPIVKKFHLHGHLSSSKGLYTIVEKLFTRTFLPVDALIPLPEPLKLTQTRGFQSHFILAKHISKKKKIPLITNFLSCLPNSTNATNAFKSPFKFQALNDTKVSIRNLHIAIIGCYMHSEYIYHHFASGLKSQGVHSISNWIIVRTPNLKN